jgi:hypothetical protein
MEYEKLLTIMLAVCFCVLVGSISTCGVVMNYQDNSAMSEMVKAGHDPISANCAIKNKSGNACSIISARGSK